MKIAVIGAGYVGISNAIILAQNHQVIVYDISEAKIAKINTKKSTVKDKLIEEYLQRKNINISGTNDIHEAVKGARYTIIATPTDYDAEKNYFNTSSVEESIKKAHEIDEKTVIIIKSTIPAGFVRKMRNKYGRKNIIYSPEFLREGNALWDNLNPSRIVVGDVSENASEFAEMMLQGAATKDIKTLFTSPDEAEAIKLFSNTFLAMRVAFFNELDTYASLREINTKTIITGVCMDPRIGDNYNNPSFGYGGYCLPKDTKQLLANYNEIPQNLIEAIVVANSTRKDFIANQVIKKKPNIVGIYRLVMKTDSDNYRSSAVQGVMKRINAKGLKIIVYEPSIAEKSFFGSQIIKDLQEFKDKSDVIIANRMDSEIMDVRAKVYTRDLYGRD